MFPIEYGIEPITLRLLYALIRIRRPSIVLESGVANGHSTVVLSNAIARNGAGALHSVDVVDNPGPLLNDAERRGWHYHRIPPLGPRREFESVVRSIGPVDLFFHDSDHSYDWQSFEYRTMNPALSADGVMVSDDVDYSYAFVDFCRRSGRTPRLLFDRRKVIGVLSPAGPMIPAKEASVLRDGSRPEPPRTS